MNNNGYMRTYFINPPTENLGDPMAACPTACYSFQAGGDPQSVKCGNRKVLFVSTKR